MIYTVNAFMLNEMELIFFSLYLEFINWKCVIIDLQDNLMLTALYVKVSVIIDI